MVGVNCLNIKIHIYVKFVSLHVLQLPWRLRSVLSPLLPPLNPGGGGTPENNNYKHMHNTVREKQKR